VAGPIDVPRGASRPGFEHTKFKELAFQLLDSRASELLDAKWTIQLL